MTAPNRRKKHDRLTYSGASKAEIECDFATGPLDRLTIEMDRKWGIDRLVELQTPEMARKFGAAMAHLNACIEKQDPAETVGAVANVMKGLQAMDRLATEAGKTPLVPDLWEFELDGRKVAIIRETGDWRAAETMRPGVTIYTMREVAVALTAKADWVADIKASFAGAEIAAIRQRTPLEESLDDEIPW